MADITITNVHLYEHKSLTRQTTISLMSPESGSENDNKKTAKDKRNTHQKRFNY